MTGDKLALEYDADGRAVWMIVTSTSGIRQKEPIWLREGFGIEDVREAILATGWVQKDAVDYRLTSDVRCATICDVVDEIFSYFRSPGDPSQELLDVQSAVAQYEVVQRARLDIPSYAYAWLDLMVRGDIADAARSARVIWNKPEVIVEVAGYCNRRVDELVSRYSQPASSVTSRMAGSIPTRQSDQSKGAG